MTTDNPFEVAPANIQLHAELVDTLTQIRDLRTDEYLQLEAASIIADCQAPLLDIIDKMAVEIEILKECD